MGSPLAGQAVNVYDQNNNVVASGQTDGGGNFSLSTSSLPVGTETLTAKYAGQGNFAPAQSSPVSEVVTSPLVQTVITLAAAPNPATQGQSVTLTGNLSTTP